MTSVLALKWDDLPRSAGAKFVGPWFRVDEDRLPMFDRATYVDSNSVELAGTNFPDGLIEGFHLLALLDHLTNEVLHVDDPRWTGWNYGLDRVRFVSPVTVNDRIRVAGRIAEVIPRGEDQLVLLHCTIDVEGRSKPGMVAEWRVLWTVADS